MTLISLYPVNILHIIYATISVVGILMVLGKPQFKGLLMLLALHAIAETLNIFEDLNITREYLLVTPALQLALGPLYYLFTKNLIYRDFSAKAHLVHLIPTCIAIAFTQWWPTLLSIAFVILAIYLVLTFRLIVYYRTLIKETTADHDEFALTWLFNTFILISVIEVFDFIRLNLQLVVNIDILVNWYFVNTLIGLLLTAYLLINAMRQPLLYSNFAEIEVLEEQKRRLAKSKKDDEQAALIFNEIEKHLTESRRYLQAKYSLRELANELGLSEQLTSWSINTYGKINFSDYINQKRINEVKRQLTEKNRDDNILNIAFNAGFNSKSTFNAVFKKNTGITPSQYIKSL